MPTWSGMVYVAFVIDAYARRILGWRAATSMRTDLVLDTIEQAIWTRQREGVTHFVGLTHHHDNGSQYESIAFTERLAAAGIDASVSAVGDALDNALAESVIGLFKTELIRRSLMPWVGSTPGVDTSVPRALQRRLVLPGERRPPAGEVAGSVD